MATKRNELVEAVPRRELGLLDEMDRAFDSLFHRGWLRPFREAWPDLTRFEETFGVGFPRVDVLDRDEEVLVRAEVPGVEKKDLHVELSGQMLTIHGERRREEKEEKRIPSARLLPRFAKTFRKASTMWCMSSRSFGG